MISAKYKLIAIASFILIIVGYIVYSQWKISSLTSENAQLQSDLQSATAYNDKLSCLVNSNQVANEQKDKDKLYIDNQITSQINSLGGLTDEGTQEFLRTPTPRPIVQLLESTDYYQRASSDVTSRSVSTSK